MHACRTVIVHVLYSYIAIAIMIIVFILLNGKHELLDAAEIYVTSSWYKPYSSSMKGEISNHG